MHATSTHPQLPGFAVNTDRLFFAEEYHLDPHQTYHFQVGTIVMKQIIFNSAFVPYLIYAKQLIKMNEERYLCTTICLYIISV
jgi:hypothetical protein